MSVYSGFATRQHEESYYKALYNMAYLMQLRILKTFKNEPFDDRRFCKYYVKLFKKLYQLDKIKYHPPKFDTAFRDLAVYIVGHKDELLEKGTSISSSSQLSQSPFSKSNWQSSSLGKDNKQKLRESFMDNEDPVTLRSMAHTQLQFHQHKTINENQQQNNQPDVNQSFPSFKNQVQVKTPQQASQSQVANRTPLLNSKGNNPEGELKNQAIISKTFYGGGERSTVGGGSAGSRAKLISQQRQKQDSILENELKNTTINNNNFIITINKNYNSRNNLQQDYLPINRQSSKILHEERSLSRRDNPSNLRNSHDKVNQSMSIPRTDKKAFKSLNSNEPLPSAQKRFKNSKFITATGTNLTFIPPASLVTMENAQEAKRQNPQQHSLDTSSQQNQSSNWPPFPDTFQSPHFQKQTMRYSRDKERIKNAVSRDEKSLTKSLGSQYTTNSNVSQVSNAQSIGGQNSLDAYKSIPIVLVPNKRKKQVGKLKQLQSNTNESRFSDHNRDSAGSRIIEEEESINESEGYQSSNLVSALEIKDKMIGGSNNNQHKIRGALGSGGKLQNRFKKLTLTIRKSTNNGVGGQQAQYTNIANNSSLLL